jgi:5'-nucleotidase
MFFYFSTQMKTIYIDMDNVLVDFDSGIKRLTNAELSEYNGRLDEVPGIFARMEPNPGAVKAFFNLCTSGKYDVYILSTAPWENPSAWSDKVVWVKKYLGMGAHKRLILSHNKHLCKGDIIIDDRTKNGVDKFEGEHIHFGTPKFPDWNAVTQYLSV